MSLPTKPSPLIAVLAGIALGMVCSVPIAAYLASWFGDTYNTRVWIYGGLLLWCIIGAVYVFRFAMKTTPKPLSLLRVLQWCISLWLWPLLWLSTLLRK